MTTENITKLIELQAELGYVPGAVHPVALLGLLGEAGEVAAEVAFKHRLPNGQQVNYGHNDFVRAIDGFVEAAEVIDDEKKSLRSNGSEGVYAIPFDDKFDDELADVFYYLNAVATGRNLTLDDLAAMCLAKVAYKRAAGMPPELLNKP